MAFLGGYTATTTTALESLVQCPCGHSIGFHSGSGCQNCDCFANRDDVLEADIDLVNIAHSA